MVWGRGGSLCFDIEAQDLGFKVQDAGSFDAGNKYQGVEGHVWMIHRYAGPNTVNKLIFM